MGKKKIYNKPQIIAKEPGLECNISYSKGSMDRLNDIIIKQNKDLLRDISIKYKWSYTDLYNKFIKNRK